MEKPSILSQIEVFLIDFNNYNSLLDSILLFSRIVYFFSNIPNFNINHRLIKEELLE